MPPLINTPTWLNKIYDLLHGLLTPGGGSVNVTASLSGALPVGSNTIGGTTDEGPGWVTVVGVGYARVTSANMSAADANLSDAVAATHRLYLDDLVVSVDTAMRVDIKESGSGTVKFSLYMAANGVAQITTRGTVVLGPGAELQGRTSASGNVAITALYHLEPV